MVPRVGKTDWDALRNKTEAEIRAGLETDSDVIPTDAEFWNDAHVVSNDSKAPSSIHPSADPA